MSAPKYILIFIFGLLCGVQLDLVLNLSNSPLVFSSKDLFDLHAKSSAVDPATSHDSSPSVRLSPSNAAGIRPKSSAVDRVSSHASSSLELINDFPVLVQRKTAEDCEVLKFLNFTPGELRLLKSSTEQFPVQPLGSEPCTNKLSCAKKMFVGVFNAMFHRKILPMVHRKAKVPRSGSPERFLHDRWLNSVVDKIAGPNCLGWGPRYESFFPQCKNWFNLEYAPTKWRPIKHKDGKVTGWYADMTNMTGVVPGNFFDTILCTQVMEHITQPVKALANIMHVLKPGGVLVWTTPFFYPYHRSPEDHFRYTDVGVKTMLESAGFEVELLDTDGNVQTAAGFLLGLDRTDFPEVALDHLRNDRAYPSMVYAIARKKKD